MGLLPCSTPAVEVLLNPVERMLAVRPCAADHPNAFLWANDKGKGRWVSAKPFCSVLFSICGWNGDIKYKVPATVRRKGGETILFFDLDNYVGILPRKQAAKAEDAGEVPEASTPEEPQDDTKGIFYAPDDEEPQEIADTEEMEQRLQALAEYEKRNFGTPAFEHDGNVRLPAIDDDGEWDVMAEARPVDSDHRVDEDIVDAIQDNMLEAMITAEAAARDDEEKDKESDET